MDSTLSLMAPGEPAFSTSPFMMQDITLTSINASGADAWDLGHNEQLLSSPQPQDDLRASISQLFGNEQPSTPAPQPSSSMRTIFGWRPSSSTNSLHYPLSFDGMPASSASCLSMTADALVPRKPNYKPIVNPGRIRIEQACEACRARKAKCDGGKTCDRCKDRGVNCAYKGSRLTRSRRSSYSEPATTTSGIPSIPSRSSTRKARSAPAPLHLVHSTLEPSHAQKRRRASPPHLPFREAPSAASSTGSFISGWSTASSSAYSTPMTADFPDFASLHAEGPSGTGAMRHSRQNSRTHPYYAPPTSSQPSFCHSSASSFLEGPPSHADFTGWTEVQFVPHPVSEQPGETSFMAVGYELSNLFGFCSALPTDNLDTLAQLSTEMPPMLNLSANPSESSNDSAKSTEPFASFESSLMLEFAHALNMASADEESKSMAISPAHSPEES